MPKKIDNIKQISLKDIKKEISIIVRRPHTAISPSANEHKQSQTITNIYHHKKIRPSTPETLIKYLKYYHIKK
jgi:hypothetical protein